LGSVPRAEEKVPYYVTNRWTGKVSLKGYNWRETKASRRRVKNWYSNKDEIGRKYSLQSQQITFNYKYGNVGALGGSWYRTWQSDPHGGRSLSAAYAGELERQGRQKATARATSIQSAQSAAIKARETYSKTIASLSKPTTIPSFSKSILNFGGTDMRQQSAAEIKRRAAIKPTTTRIPTPISKPLTKARNRPTYTGVKFVQKASQTVAVPVVIREGIKQSQQPDANLVSPYLQPQKIAWEVTTPDGKTRQFKTKETAEKFIATGIRPVVTEIKVPQEQPKLNPRQQRFDYLLQTLDKAEQYKPKDPLSRFAFESVLAFPIGVVKSGLAAVSSIDNLITQHITKENQIPIPRSGDEVILPLAITKDGVRVKSGDEIFKDTQDYVKKYSPQSFLGGVVSTYVPIGMGVATGVKIGARIVTKQVIKSPAFIDAAIQTPVKITKVPMQIKPRVQGSLTNEAVMKLVTPEKVRIVKGSTKVPTKLDPTYKPVSRANELDIGSGVLPKEGVFQKISTSKGFIPNKPKTAADIQFEKSQKALKNPKPIEPEFDYKPATRANEIDFTDKGNWINTGVKLGVSERLDF